MLSDLQEMVASGADLNVKDEQGVALVRDRITYRQDDHFEYCKN